MHILILPRTPCRLSDPLSYLFFASSAYVDTVRGGIFWRRPKACRGRRVGGSGGRSPPDAGKIFKKTNEKLQFYGNFSKF